MYKIGMIGNRDAVLGFMAVGFSVCEVDGVEAASKQLQKMVKSGDYGVIFVTEHYAVALEEQIASYGSLPIPAIVNTVCVGVIALTTLYSGVEYFVQNKDAIQTM